MDHTNEQQRMLEQKRQEIAEQVKKHLKMNPSLNHCMKVTNKMGCFDNRIVVKNQFHIKKSTTHSQKVYC